MDESEDRAQRLWDLRMEREAKERARLEWLMSAAEKNGNLRRYTVAHELPNGGWAAFEGLTPVGWGETREAAIDAAVSHHQQRAAKL